MGVMMEQQQVHLAPGKHLGVYEIKGVEDIDPVCITYCAWNHHLQAEAAIKEFFPGALARRGDDGQSVQPQSDGHRDDYQEGLTKFLAEATRLLQIQHPNVEHMHNVLEVHGTAYLVMDYEAGTLLATRRKDGLQPQLTEDELESVALPLLEALASVHAQGLLHEGLSPASIRLRADGTPVLVDLARFRLGSIMQDKGPPVPLAEGYTAPEQDQPQGRLGPWTDLYALGATLYCCLRGQAPGSVRAGASAWQAEATELPSVPEQTPIGDGAPLRDIIDWMLSPRIEDRPQSAEAVLTRLRALHRETAAGSPSLHPAVSGASQGGLWAALRHSHARAGAGAVVVLALLLGLFWYSRPDKLTSEPAGIGAERQAEVVPGEERARASAADSEPSQAQAALEPKMAAKGQGAAASTQEQPALALAQGAQDAPASAPTPSAAKEAQPAQTTSPTEAEVQPPPEQNGVDPGPSLPPTGLEPKPKSDFSVPSAEKKQQPFTESEEGIGASETQARTVEAVKSTSLEPGNGDETAADRPSSGPESDESLPQAAQPPSSKADTSRLKEQELEPGVASRPQPSPSQPETPRLVEETLVEETLVEETLVEETIEQHLASAAEDLEALRLTTPEGNNAFEHYKAVLELAPDHPKARSGLKQIVQRYEWLIDKALHEQHFARARIYLRRAQRVLPDAPALRELRTELEMAQQ